MAKRGSRISRSAQVPVVIALVVVFAAVLFWRFAPKAETKVEAAGQLHKNSNVSTSQLAELKSLIDRVEQGSSGHDADSSEWQPLKRDPFMRAKAFLSDFFGNTVAGALMVGEGDGGRNGRGIIRREFLDSAALSGVFVMGSQSVIILNNQYLHLGDKVGGFIIKRIFEDRIILEDPLGLETLWVGELFRGKDEGSAEETNL